jgi:hypothetical protein
MVGHSQSIVRCYPDESPALRPCAVSLPVLKQALGSRLNADAIINCILDPLLEAEISLSCLNRDMTEYKLDLFQFATGNVAQASTRASEIMRSRLGQAELCRVLFHKVPDHSVGYEIAPGRSTRQTNRNSFPPLMPDALSQLTQLGIGMVRTCPPFPAV